MVRGSPPVLDRNRLALSLRQPWVELILRGVKSLEVRSTGTQIRGPIYLYASKRLSDHPAAAAAIAGHGLDVGRLPLSAVLGQAEVVGCRPALPEDAAAACVAAAHLGGKFVWELARPVRFAVPQAVRFLPYGVWFYPWKREGKSGKNGGSPLTGKRNISKLADTR